MNNVFKKRFRRRLGLLAECDKVSAILRENELDADFNSRRKNPVTYIPNLPILKTAAGSYTRRMYSEFEEQFKEQFQFSWKFIGTINDLLKFTCRPVESEMLLRMPSRLNNVLA